MGLFKLSGGSTIAEGNPNPSQYQIKKVAKVRATRFHQTKIVRYVALIHYPGCKNFEGNKIIVFSDDPRQMSAIDPHFEEFNSVMARFRPTKSGWEQAKRFAELC